LADLIARDHLFYLYLSRESLNLYYFKVLTFERWLVQTCCRIGWRAALCYRKNCL